MPLPIALFVLGCLAVSFAFGLVFVGRALFDDQATGSMGPSTNSSATDSRLAEAPPSEPEDDRPEL